MTFTINKKKETISIDYIEFNDQISYTYGFCTSENCDVLKSQYNAKVGTKILTVAYGSDNYDGKEMIDFSTKYGKINYIDNNHNKHTIEVYNPIQNSYYGKFMYIRVPEEVENAKTIEIVYTVRNKQYTYKLK